MILLYQYNFLLPALPRCPRLNRSQICSSSSVGAPASIAWDSFQSREFGKLEEKFLSKVSNFWPPTFNTTDNGIRLSLLRSDDAESKIARGALFSIDILLAGKTGAGFTVATRLRDDVLCVVDVIWFETDFPSFSTEELLLCGRTPLFLTSIEPSSAAFSSMTSRFLERARYV